MVQHETFYFVFLILLDKVIKGFIFSCYSMLRLSICVCVVLSKSRNIKSGGLVLAGLSYFSGKSHVIRV